MPKNVYIEAKNISKKFKKLSVLENINFQVEKGEFVAMVGPNGSGKTTLARILLGLEKQTKGSVYINGKMNTSVQDVFGYIPQRFSFDRSLPITVKEFLSLSVCSSNKCSVEHTSHYDQVLEKLGIKDIDTYKLGVLSGGQLQRVLIARALLHDRPIIVLDEPAAGIDVEGQKKVYALLKDISKKKNTTIFIISHEIDFVLKYATHVLCINKELLCAGPPNTIETDKKISELFGEHMRHMHHSHS